MLVMPMLCVSFPREGQQLCKARFTAAPCAKVTCSCCANKCRPSGSRPEGEHVLEWLAGWQCGDRELMLWAYDAVSVELRIPRTTLASKELVKFSAKTRDEPFTAHTFRLQ
jgi:hypothetical protein